LPEVILSAIFSSAIHLVFLPEAPNGGTNREGAAILIE
jgi:hypothetical protein